MYSTVDNTVCIDVYCAQYYGQYSLLEVVSLDNRSAR